MMWPELVWFGPANSVLKLHSVEVASHNQIGYSRDSAVQIQKSEECNGQANALRR